MVAEFTVISPMYNVARYLPEFFASLERQTYGFERIEVILVDDGSTDDTADIAEAFARTRSNVRVIRKANGGQASARNAALPLATGTWLTFPDPDDVLSDGYFATVAATVDPVHPQAMLSTRLMLWFEADDEVKDTHALDGRFRNGIATRNLRESPSWIQPHITSGFVQRRVVAEAGLDFPEELRLRFEDGAFVSRYLLRFADPVVTFIPGAEYLYRQRSDSSSTIQTSSADPAKYTDTLRLGFLPVIAEALKRSDALPGWLQNLFLYDQFWILRSSQSPAVRNARFPASMHAELDELLPTVLQHIDDERILAFDLMYVAPWMREALVLVKHGDGFGPVYRGQVDHRRGLRSIVYRYRGDAPALTVRSNGAELAVAHRKSLGLEYAGRPIVFQETAWISDAEDVEVLLDGQVQIVHDRPAKVDPAFPTRVSDSRARRQLRRATKAITRRLSRGGLRVVRRDAAVRSKRLAERFAHAWVFIDRDVDAGDSAEDQYWWVKEHHPEINAWFVVREGTPDWDRLSAAGARLVGYGTPAFFALLKHADHLASSHADRFITHALPPKMRPADYAFTFLQHGVIKGDISHWLNPKDFQVFIASTPDEYRYLTESTAYRHSTKEIVLAGLPRFDVLKERADAVPDEERDLILVMPTWRDYLVGRMGKTSGEREPIADFGETAYARSISELLNDPRLLDAAERTGRRIVFMPHPNMQQYLADFAVPDSVSIRSYADTDVREMIVHASMLITDYSSIAFNAAYLHAPVLYFQFDAEEYFTGHTERPGYFDYERDGFGPVTATAEDAAKAAERILTEGIDPEHVQRMRRAFPTRDGRNRQRVHEAMLGARTRPSAP
ncbi:bifunctional glycosyltransferase/CDP-glycerol:glycerophosphate glycerophosphotransferase [Microbacterium sp. NPDC055903]